MRDFFIKYLFLLFTWLIAYFTPALPLMFSIGVLILLDFATGIQAAKKRGELITSKKMRPTVTKGFGYMMAIIAAHVFENVIPGLESTKIVTGLIAVIEIKSLDENIRVITGKNKKKKITKR